MGLGVTVGIVGGAAVGLAAAAGEGTVNQYTPIEAGSPARDKALKEDCSDPPNADCARQAAFSSRTILHGEAGVDPLLGEAFFRGFPSCLLGPEEPDKSSRAEVFLAGTGKNLLLSRREVVIGAVTTIGSTFILNNAFPGRFDVTKLPVAGMIENSALWWLQRRFGYFSNFTARVVMNGVAGWRDYWSLRR